MRDFLSFFSRVAARSGAVVSCVHDLRLWSTFSQGLQLWWGGGAFVGDAFPAVVACVLARLCLFAKKKPTVDLRVVPRRLGRAALESPCRARTPVPNVSHAIENQLADDLHPPFLASSCRKATPLPFEQDQLLWPPPSHRYSSRGRPSGQRRNVIRTAPKPEYKFGTGTGRPSGQRRNVIRTAPPKRRTSSRPTGRT